MVVYFYDNIGEVAVKVDFRNIQFCNGECYFSSDGEEYRIPVSRLIEIIQI